ncbi:MAG: hypothetical protein NT014_06560 [Candidatus Omnitrophica bacterium]|nr:hypothetical protein [Candidatus Omnitrophota bacterium]
MKNKHIENLALPLILCVAVINHLVTFWAYTWYAGVDSYGYDICGLQLVSGRIFDLYPILFRPPLIPVVKNILYLIFEGHPYVLAGLIHLLGIVMVVLVYRISYRFHKGIGFVVGILTASNLSIAVNFHHISVFTIFVPLLLLTVDRFIIWVQNPDRRSLVFLILMTSLCSLARTEALILIPIFAFFGILSHRNFKSVLFFLLSCTIIYNLVCFIYYKNFGYWGITHHTGWALSARMMRAQDQQFSKDNGPASQKVYEYMLSEWPSRVRSVDPLRAHMFTLNLAQEDLGYLKADDLFLRASLESIRSDPGMFFRNTLLRMLGQLGLYRNPELRYKEFFYETQSGHMWGFYEERMLRNQGYYNHWTRFLPDIKSPLIWERQVLKARFLNLFGFKYAIPDFPKEFAFMQSVKVEPSGKLKWLYCGDAHMTERFRYCLDLDAYFFLGYWGQRNWSKTALKILGYWDKILMSKALSSTNAYRLMWVFWIMAFFLLSPGWRLAVLAALLSIVVTYALLQAVFTDNFGGRHELYMRIFLWLGCSCGILGIIQKWKQKNKSEHLVDGKK